MKMLKLKENFTALQKLRRSNEHCDTYERKAQANPQTVNLMTQEWKSVSSMQNTKELNILS